MIACASTMSAARRTKESAIQSMPSVGPESKSARSFSVIADSGSTTSNVSRSSWRGSSDSTMAPGAASGGDASGRDGLYLGRVHFRSGRDFVQRVQVFGVGLAVEHLSQPHAVDRTDPAADGHRADRIADRV